MEEKLSDVVHKSGLSLLHISILNLQTFRDSYGFVASDDVLRAISMMILNTLKETGSPEDFLGHLGPSDFVVVLSPETLPPFQEKIKARLEQSLDYFYPLSDREQASKNTDRLAIHVNEISSVYGRYSSVDQLKKELLSRSN